MAVEIDLEAAAEIGAEIGAEIEAEAAAGVRGSDDDGVKVKVGE
ncbi:hypothetical protein [Sinosporangium siamense]|uniref:Uncharacterized protein n=1 Tax=Sinosporangium siamense TaxID=1367973 RepID=A0A919RNX8_9ACTN|nr:hypothetical protein [Sinosporangium siamense]GII97255.1 hypothetical protein Ssi02_74860 [Sinosporangium siamense]